VIAATVTHATEELLEAVFSMQSALRLYIPGTKMELQEVDNGYQLRLQVSLQAVNISQRWTDMATRQAMARGCGHEEL
jgi:hypothetical protein